MARTSGAAKAIAAIAGELGMGSRQVEQAISAAGLDMKALSKMPPQEAARLVHEARTRALTGRPSTFYGPATPSFEVAPAPKPAPVADKPPTLAQRLSSDPNVHEALAERADDLRAIDPRIAERVAAGDPRATVVGYRRLATTPEDEIRRLREAVAKPADQAAAEGIADQFDRATFADDTARQTELPFADNPEPRPALPVEPDSAAVKALSDYRAARAARDVASRRAAAAAAATAVGAGTAGALMLGGGDTDNPATLTEDPISLDTYERPDPFAPTPADPVVIHRKTFYDYPAFDPLMGFDADYLGKPLPAQQAQEPPMPPATKKKARRPDNVENDLDAAAVPIEPEGEARAPVTPPEKSPQEAYRARLQAAGYTPGEVDMIMAHEARQPGAFQFPESEESLRAAVGRTRQREGRQAAFDASMAEAMGHNYQGPAAPRSTVMVDGYELPSVVGALGQPMGDGQYYRLGDLHAAQRAEREARWMAGHRAMVEDDIRKFGHYSLPDTSDELTPAQEAARDARKRAETNQESQRQAQRAFQIENANRPLTPFEQKQKERSERYAAMAALVGGSQNLNGGNRATAHALALLDGVKPEDMDAQQQALMQNLPMDRARAAVEAQQLGNFQQWMRQFGTAGFGGLFNDPRASAVATQLQEQKLREMNPLAAGVQDIAGGNPHTPQARAALEDLATAHDTGGFGTMSWDDENRLAATLQKFPYNMKQPEAEAAAHRAAESRRFSIFGATGWTNPHTGAGREDSAVPVAMEVNPL